jgi:DNA helicase-2/ATP-dependent DNA helicase PcrA
MVVLDDEEATYSLYSYEKLLGLRSLSDKDKENQAAGTDSVLDRTRRLFYVCCSRAIKDLVVVLFTANVAEASRILKGGNIFEPACIRTIEDLTV